MADFLIEIDEIVINRMLFAKPDNSLEVKSLIDKELRITHTFNIHIQHEFKLKETVLS